MVKLRDYLGSIVESVNSARTIADIESVKVAKLYLQDDLLKYFPIPRFRTKSIELSIPIAIEKIEKSPQLDYEPIDNPKFISTIYQTLKDKAEVGSFKSDKSRKILKFISNITTEIEVKIKSGHSIKNVLKEGIEQINDFFNNEINLSTKSRVKKEDENNSPKILIKLLYDRLVPLISERKDVPNYADNYIIYEAEKLKEIETEKLVHIKMTLMEEGMEWVHTVNEEGEKKSKLMLE